MTQKLKLWFFSLVLLFINLALLVGLGFSYFNSDQKNLDAVVLGVSVNAPVYNPNYVLSNDTFRSRRVFGTQESVQNYLSSVNSPLKGYQINGKSAAYWIFNAANGTTSSRFGVKPNLNPAVLIAYLEKEQSLISLSSYDTVNDPQRRLKTAMGYGCPDNSQCDSKFFGLDNQLNWAAYQLEYNFALAGGSNSDPYKVNRTITTLDGYKVFLSNQATAANYRYTPHAYFGNYNLWKIITANGWGVDSNTHSPSYIDQINISKIETKDGVENPALSESEVSEVLGRKYNIGYSGGDVILLQRFLRQKGFFTYDSITGYYGTFTQTAHQNYLAGKNSATELPTTVSTKPSCDDLTKRNYSRGQNDDTVKALQECLRGSGHFTYSISTGYYGAITEKAQIDFLNSLKSKTTPAPTPTPVVSTDPCETLKSKSFKANETSQDVLKLQQCMRKSGVFNWPFDTGFFGPVTQEAFSKYKGGGNVSFSCGNLKGQEYRFGESSERVKQLQACMRTAGVFSFSGGNTGYFGEATKAGLIKWRGYF